MILRKNRQLSGNPNDELQGNLGETEMGTWQKMKWTVVDEAIHRGMNYAKDKEAEFLMLKRDEGMTFHAMLKNAYQEGFLHGFEHKFDNTNYEEK